MAKNMKKSRAAGLRSSDLILIIAMIGMGKLKQYSIF
jgi:hypothetical protein